MKPLSIRLQLSLMMSLRTLVIIAILSVSAYIEFKESLLGNVDATLLAVSEEFEPSSTMRTLRNREAELQAIVGQDRTGHSSECRVWVDGDPADLFTTGSSGSPLARELLQPPAKARPKPGDFSLFNIDGGEEPGPRRAMWMRQAAGQRIVNILVARSSSHVYHELSEFLCLLLVSGGGVTLVALLLVPRIVSFGLRPVAHAGQRLEQVTTAISRRKSPSWATSPGN